MNIEKLPIDFIKEKLKALDLLNEDGTPVKLGVFRNRASVGKYGKGGQNQLKIVLAGHPRENLFGFYVNCNPDPLAMKEAYKWYLDLLKGDFEELDIEWGNMGIPIGYGRLRALLPDEMLK